MSWTKLINPTKVKRKESFLVLKRIKENYRRNPNDNVMFVKKWDIMHKIAGIKATKGGKCEFRWRFCLYCGEVLGWWYNTCATIHICNDKSLFKTYYDLNNGQYSNEKWRQSVSKGNVDIIFTSKKKIT